MDPIPMRTRLLSKDIIYAEIKKQIIHGELAPDQSLVEEHLVKELGVSRTPLREAVQRLEMEQFVVRQPNGRLKVAPISQQEVEEVFTVRSMLEGIMARTAALKATEADILRLRQSVEKLEEGLRQENEEDILRFGGQFRSQLYAISGNATVEHLLNMIHDRVQRYRMLILKNKLAKSKTMAAEHRRILACIEKQDGDGAESAMREHILSTKDETARGVEQRLEKSGNVPE